MKKKPILKSHKLPEQLHDALKIQAAIEKRTMQELTTEILWDGLKQRQKKRAALRADLLDTESAEKSE